MRSVSIVLTYYNRPDQLRHTIRSLQAFGGQNLPDVQLVVVDDASIPQLSARMVLDQIALPVTLIELSQEEKTWTNPSVPYNRGFAAATGEIVLIQNSESLHMGNLLNVIRSQVNDQTYHVFPCYSSTQLQFQQMIQCWDASDICWHSQITHILEPLQDDQWHHHPIHLPTWYHFASAMTRNTLNKLGGFDERFANGYCFDDNNFLFRIRQMGLHIPAIYPNQGYVVHQWHPKNPGIHGGCALWEINRKLHNEIQAGEQPLLDPNRTLR